MIFFTHRNFPAYLEDVLGTFLKHYDGGIHSIESCRELYPDEAPDSEWIIALGKSKPKRVILAMDDGVRRNAVFREMLRKSGCTYVYLAAKWSKIEWDLAAARIIQHWSKIVSVVDAAIAADQQCIVEVSENGRVHRTTL